MSGVKMTRIGAVCIAMFVFGLFEAGSTWAATPVEDPDLESPSPIVQHTVPDFTKTGKDGITLTQAYYIVSIVARWEHYRVEDRASFIERLTVDAGGEVEPYPGFFDLRIGFDRERYAFIYYPRDYFISKITGDVWQTRVPGALHCYRVSFAALRAIQRKIMARTGATFASEKRERRGLYCADE